jgi:hypothetical protein
MKNSLKSLLLTVAVSGLLSGAALAQQSGNASGDKKDQPKAEKNSCKGKAGCGAKADNKAADNKDAKDKNSCSANKGQGKDKNSCSANKGQDNQKPPSA